MIWRLMILSTLTLSTVATAQVTPKIKNGRQYYVSLSRVVELPIEDFDRIAEAFPGMPEGSEAKDLVAAFDVYARLAALVCENAAAQWVNLGHNQIDAVRLHSLFRRFARRSPSASELNLLLLAAPTSSVADRWFGACLAMALLPEFIFLPNSN